MIKTENCRSMKVLSHRKGRPGPPHVPGGADWYVRSVSELFVRRLEQLVEGVSTACREQLAARVVSTQKHGALGLEFEDMDSVVETLITFSLCSNPNMCNCAMLCSPPTAEGTINRLPTLAPFCSPTV